MGGTGSPKPGNGKQRLTNGHASSDLAARGGDGAPRASGPDSRAADAELSGVVEDQTLSDADQTAADADQTLSDADQTASDADLTSAEQDEADSRADQQAADADQARADHRWAVGSDAGSDPGDAADADASRAKRAAGKAHREASQASRLRTAHDRSLTAEDRDATADARDESARRRDERAKALDDAVSASDASLAEKLEEIRSRAAADRARAAADRERAARDRADATRERDRLYGELQKAHLDELTGALGRELGRAEMTNGIERARRGDGRFVVAYVDVDGMKGINDVQGHAAGDRVLQTVVSIMRAHMRSFDPIVRFGGDEFVCGLGGVDLATVVARFDTIGREIQDAIGVGISVGLAAHADDETLDQLTARADAALLDVKKRHDAT